MLLVGLAAQSEAMAEHICSYELDVDYGRGSRTHTTSTTKEGCCEACWRRHGCAVGIFVSGQSICWLKPKAALKRPNPKRGAIACRARGRHSFMNASYLVNAKHGGHGRIDASPSQRIVMMRPNPASSNVCRRHPRACASYGLHNQTSTHNASWQLNASALPGIGEGARGREICRHEGRVVIPEGICMLSAC